MQKMLLVICAALLVGVGCSSTKPGPGGTAQACVIKGNISASGEKIYHLPGCDFYDKTVINESAGERMFCTEEAAIAAGWRKAADCNGPSKNPPENNADLSQAIDARTRCIDVGKGVLPIFDETFVGPATRYQRGDSVTVFTNNATLYYALDEYIVCIENELGFDTNPQLKQLRDNAKSAQWDLFTEIRKVFKTNPKFCAQNFPLDEKGYVPLDSFCGKLLEKDMFYK